MRKDADSKCCVIFFKSLVDLLYNYLLKHLLYVPISTFVIAAVDTSPPKSMKAHMKGRLSVRLIS